MKNKFVLSAVAASTSLAFFVSGVSAQHIFWTELGTGDTYPGAVWTADATGTNPQEIVSGLDGPIGIDLDVANGHMYIAENVGGRILRAPLAGGAVTELVTGRVNPQMLSLDLAGGKVFWTEYSGNVMSSDLDGSNVQTVVDDFDRYTALALDFGNERLYASDPSPGDLQISDFDGGNAVSENRFGGWSTNGMLIEGDQMYYSYDDEIRVSDLDGSNETTLGTVAIDDGPYALGLAMGPDGTLYWATRASDNREDGGYIGMYDGDDFVSTFIAAGDPFDVAVVPEPSTYALIFGGVVGLLVFARRRFLK